MARHIDDEQRSYSAVFLLGVGFLLVGAIWAVVDDNIFRRPWKKFQHEFYTMQIDRLREAIRQEEERLRKDPEYQRVTRDLARERQKVESGAAARELEDLAKRRAAVQLDVNDYDLALRIVKSQLEEAWYEIEHAELLRHDSSKQRAHKDELERRQEETERKLEEKLAELERIDKQTEELQSVVRDLERTRRDLEAAKERLQQRLDSLLIRFGPFEWHKVPRIEQVVLNEFDRNNFDQPVARVDRCQSCHAGIEKPGFENDPNPYKTHPHRDPLLTKHPVERFGCTPCHGGQGAAVNSVKKAHGEVKFWEHPLMRGEMAQSSCISCHLDVKTEQAKTIELGEKLFVNLGCHGCHLVSGYGELEKVGPYLRRIAAKVEPGWLVRWVENPHEFRPRSKMPNFFPPGSVGEKNKVAESRAIAAYLLSVSKEESERWLAERPVPSGIDPSDPAKVAHGRELVDSLGCRGCHGIGPDESPLLLGKSKDVAPNLVRIAEKTTPRWLYHWIKDPRGYSPEARMPSLRLSDEEAASIVSYLATLGSPRPADPALLEHLQRPDVIKEGERLVRKYGCAGCHDIPGMEDESRIGVELSTFGSKTLDELFFGNRTDIPVTWHDWTVNKIKTPRTYETERIEQVMPQFDLHEHDIEALAVFLHSRKAEKVPEAFLPDLERERKLVRGRIIVQKYNCLGCHVIENEGGAIRAHYEENPTFAPPILTGEGAKVQPDWLFGFLKRPVVLRPWLKVRMPTFGLSDEEAHALVEYFMALDRVDIPFSYVDLAAVPTELIKAGETLASADYLNCFSCHQKGEQKPEGPEEGWAPDLALAHERLNPEWVVQWLRDPQKLMPGTKMPSFYNFEDDIPDGPEDILGGNDERQVEALRDYIMSLGATPHVQAAAGTDAVRARN